MKHPLLNLAQTFDEATAAVGRLSSLLTWLIESGEIVPDEPELELTSEDHCLLRGMRILSASFH
jgi:hypothetical protein